jgi:PAS domain S-box-containing protein
MLRAGWHRIEAFLKEALQFSRATRGFPLSFREALDKSLQAIAFSDSLGCFRYANPAFLQFFGYQHPEQIYRRWLFEFLAHPEQSAEILSALRERGTWKGLTEARRLDSSVLPVEITAYAIGGACARLDWARWYFVAPALQPAESPQAGDLPALAAAGLAHDLNNLLTVVTGYSQLALSRSADGPDHGLWEAVLDTGQRAAEINQQFLELSRAQTSAIEPVLLDAAVRQAAEVLARLAGPGISIQLKLAAGEASIRLHRTELLQILMNLVLNSRDAISGDGVITIETCRNMAEQSSVILTVHDNGAGMDDATRSHAFEPFFSSKRGSQNSGLGLAIVASLVRKAGGRAQVESQLGAGATFQLYFPEAASPAVFNTKE